MNNYKLSLANADNVTSEAITRALQVTHTSLPARVISFDPARSTVSLEILINKIMQDGSSEDYPPLLDVPVSYPRGSGFSVTFPLTAGDEGLAVFAERCIDGWFESGDASAPLDYRLHDLSDAFFIPGASSKPKALKNLFTGGLSLQTDDGATFIRIVNGKILIQGDIEHVGDNTQDGKHEATGDVKAGGISLQNHVHSGVKAGDSKTQKAE